MPVQKVGSGWRWGSTGKVHPTRAGAEAEQRAAYANGYGKRRAKKQTRKKKR